MKPINYNLLSLVRRNIDKKFYFILSSHLTKIFTLSRITK